MYFYFSLSVRARALHAAGAPAPTCSRPANDARAAEGGLKWAAGGAWPGAGGVAARRRGTSGRGVAGGSLALPGSGARGMAGAGAEAAAAALWGEARAVLPGAEADVAAALGALEAEAGPVLALLQRARALVYEGGAPRAGPPRARELEALGRAAGAAADYAWERLQARAWRDVEPGWRRAFALACLFRALALLGQPARALRACDRGLLLGAAVLDGALARLARLLQRRLPRARAPAPPPPPPKVPACRAARAEKR